MPGLGWEILRFRGAEAVQNLHPLIVHYPIALLTASVPLYLLAWALRREALAVVALWLLELGALSAIVAAYTGLGAGDSVMVAPSVREHILVYHERIMLSVTGISLVLAGWAWLARPMPRRGRVVFMAALLLMAAVLAKGADFGGWMVYGYNAGGSLPQPIEFSQ
ncbi:MAG TPA: DUF2231 domain-containing protein [Candidatus Binataceae bacterium]|nr:DUF2231 domain-containing protein [Candidatus Binataceae bacterium]